MIGFKISILIVAVIILFDFIESSYELLIEKRKYRKHDKKRAIERRMGYMLNKLEIY